MFTSVLLKGDKLKMSIDWKKLFILGTIRILRDFYNISCILVIYCRASSVFYGSKLVNLILFEIR